MKNEREIIDSLEPQPDQFTESQLIAASSLVNKTFAMIQCNGFQDVGHKLQGL